MVILNGKRNQKQNFCDQVLISLFHIYWTWNKKIKKILGAKRSCGRWSDIEGATLPEIIISMVMLENVLPINILGLFLTLVG